jgi:hypothetical protein
MITMNVEGYYVQGQRSRLPLHEKGGKQHDVPAHHSLEACQPVELSAISRL